MEQSPPRHWSWSKTETSHFGICKKSSFGSLKEVSFKIFQSFSSCLLDLHHVYIYIRICRTQKLVWSEWSHIHTWTRPSWVTRVGSLCASRRFCQISAWSIGSRHSRQRSDNPDDVFQCFSEELNFTHASLTCIFWLKNLWSCQESQELSQEIDDVLHLLQSVRSKGEASVVSWATPLMTCIVVLVVSIQAWRKFQAYIYIYISGTSSQRKACLCQATMKSQLVWEHLHYLNIPNLRTVEMQLNALSGWVEKTESKKASESCVAALLEYQTLSQNRFKHSASALSNDNWRKRQTANHRLKSWTNCFLLRTIFFSEGTQTWNEGLVVPLCAQFTQFFFPRFESKVNLHKDCDFFLANFEALNLSRPEWILNSGLSCWSYIGTWM